MRYAVLLYLPLALPAACTPPPASDARVVGGYEQIFRENYDAALVSFEHALTSMDPADPEYLRAYFGHIQAQVQIDAGEALREFFELSDSMPGTLTAREFLVVGSWLNEVEADQEVTSLLEFGSEKFPGAPEVVLLRERFQARFAHLIPLCGY